MFGNDKPADQTQTDNQQAAGSGSLAEPTLGQPFNVTGPAPSTTVTPTEPTSAPPTEEVTSTPHAEEAAPPAEAPPAETPAADSAPAEDAALPSVSEPDASATAPAVDTPAADTGELTSIKQEALQQLSPLVDQLDQTPEEKFRTTMMMIQAADNQTLIKTAYDAAQEIKDEKERAQALLDVINEINYFSQQKKES